MPFTFLAHQAPVLPLKLWRPRWFSGAGLVIGSMAPDFEKFVHGVDAGRFGHTLIGQVVYCLPMSLAVHWLLTRVVAEPLARYAPDLGPFHLRDYAASLAAAPSGRWLVVGSSALVGSVSHVVFDGFTHADRRVVALFPFLADRLVLLHGHVRSLVSLLQIGASAVAAAFVLALMYYIGRRRRALAWRGLPALPVDRRVGPPRAAREYWLVVALATAALSAAFAAGGAPDGGPYREHAAVYGVVLRLPLTAFLAAGVAAFVDTVRRAAALRAHVVARAAERRRRRGHPTPHQPRSRAS